MKQSFLSRIGTFLNGFVTYFSSFFSKGETDGSKNQYAPARRRMTLKELREYRKAKGKRVITNKMKKARAKAKRAKKARKINYRAAKLAKLQRRQKIAA